ncbi:sensor histidine kinase [Paraburkholderia hospita]|uniref:sensor histidine kinase n=1 Tax=Paraburkholderia hospita TaxID=169430 RepID=UPI001405080B|nr:sensor histidine kinase [Paraburkholderia hospita]
MKVSTVEYRGSSPSSYSLKAYLFIKTKCHAGGSTINGVEPTEQIIQDPSLAQKKEASFLADISSIARCVRSGEFIDFGNISQNRPERDRLMQLEHASRFAATIESTREAEKKRIARELHDDLGQQLSGLKMDLAALRAELDVIGTPQPFISRIDEIQCAIDRAVSSVRRVAAGLRPAVLDDLGLLPALEWLIDDFRERSGIRATLHNGTCDIEFNDLASTALFRIVQEALTNVARHAKDATEVTVELALRGGVCVQTISDNGVASGTVSSHCSGAHPSGLAGIQERVRQLGGTMNVGRTLEHGFRVAVSVPVREVRRK